MKEIWKDVMGYEDLYQVSNLGRVRSLDREVISIKGTTYHLRGKLLNQRVNNSGYKFVCIRKQGEADYPFVHRLVACAFIPNNLGLPWVNHKDENKLNNEVNNLEWCTPAYNSTYGSRKDWQQRYLTKPILCIETGKLFSSLTECAREIHKTRSTSIESIKTLISASALKGIPAYGYHYKYKS